MVDRLDDFLVPVNFATLNHAARLLYIFSLTILYGYLCMLDLLMKLYNACSLYGLILYFPNIFALYIYQVDHRNTI